MSKRNQPQTTAPACRLAISQQALDETGLEAATWQVLVDSIFPTAKTVEGVLLAVRYCQARGLDVMKRPVHVVPMWNRALGREVETVWPGIAEVQTTAARTGQWAGMEPARFGPEETRIFTGQSKTEAGWQDMQVQVTFPAWCEVTVYRLVGGLRCPFTETVFWEETYSRLSGGEVPTAMWVKRPRGQLLRIWRTIRSCNGDSPWRIRLDAGLNSVMTRCCCPSVPNPVCIRCCAVPSMASTTSANPWS